MSNVNEGVRLATVGLLREQGEDSYAIGMETKDRVVGFVTDLLAETTTDDVKGATLIGIALAVLEIHEIMEDL